MDNFHSRLIEARESKRLNQAKLARLCGVTQSAISLLEKGKRKPGLELSAKLSDALDVTCDYLAGRDANKK